MDDMRMMQVLCDELEDIANKGLTNANLERTYKLIDMYKDMKQVEYYNSMIDGGNSQYGNSQYGNSRGGDYNRGNSYGEHYVRGHYSKENNRGWDNSQAYNRYMDSKRQYRTSQSEDCKRMVMNTLDQYMEDFANRMEQLADDADCREERDTINKYIQKIREIR